MKFKFWTPIFILLGLVTGTSQSLGQSDLNARLKNALCAQDWQQAIRIVDRMRAIAQPSERDQLLLYRGQLETFASSRARIPNWPADCPRAAAPAPAPSPEAAPTPAASTVQGEVTVTQIQAPYRTYRVFGTVKNNTNNPVSGVTVKFEIARSQNADGETLSEPQVTSSGTVAIPNPLAPGEEARFETTVNSRVRGDARVASVTWKNADGSTGSNPPAPK